MTVFRVEPCLDLYVWRGHWMLRSRHGTSAELLNALSRVEPGVRVRVRRSARRVVGFKQPDHPTQARAHREAVAEAMVVRRQAFKIYKSSSNGTELASIPEEGVIK